MYFIRAMMQISSDYECKQCIKLNPNQLQHNWIQKWRHRGGKLVIGKNYLKGDFLKRDIKDIFGILS